MAAVDVRARICDGTRVCSRCERTYSSPYALIVHHKTCRGWRQKTCSKSPVCPKCSKTLSSPYKVAAHLKVCRGRKNPGTSSASTSCDICARILSSSWALARHVRICAGPRPCIYECPKCGKQTPRRYVHVRHVHGCSYLRCTHPECKSFRFTSSALLESHLRVSHGGRRPASPVGPEESD